MSGMLVSGLLWKTKRAKITKETNWTISGSGEDTDEKVGITNLTLKNKMEELKNQEETPEEETSEEEEKEEEE